NVDTRLAKVADGEFAAAILAEAGLQRRGRGAAVAERCRCDRVVPAPGQGARAVEAATGTAGAAVGGALDDPSLRLLLHAERLLLAETGAGCRSALGAVAEWDDGIRLTAFVSDEKGSRRAVVWGSPRRRSSQQPERSWGCEEGGDHHRPFRGRRSLVRRPG